MRGNRRPDENDLPKDFGTKNTANWTTTVLLIVLVPYNLHLRAPDTKIITIKMFEQDFYIRHYACHATTLGKSITIELIQWAGERHYSFSRHKNA